MKIEGVKRATKRVEDMQFFFTNQEMLEKKYPGKWVAIEGGHLVGVGDTLEEASNAALARGASDPLMADIKSEQYQGVFLIRRCP